MSFPDDIDPTDYLELPEPTCYFCNGFVNPWSEACIDLAEGDRYAGTVWFCDECAKEL